MLPDLSPAHILIVVVVALIVVGPKDLPLLLRKIGKFMGKMRGMANEFRASFDEMARQSELDELRKEVEAMRQASQNALPQTLGIEAALNSDAESAYMANWAASHGPSTDAVAADAHSILPPTSIEAAAPVKAVKTPKIAAKGAKASKTTTAKTAAKSAKAAAAPKPRAKKVKPEAGA
jgi:sec-independent protein translocase protein TatB